MSLLRGSHRHKLRFHKHFSSQINVKTKSNELSSLEIRNMFLDFFIDKNAHKFIRSSPVIPFCDPSVPFVNAGMNQFKNVFLNKENAPCDSAANYQKCIRIGGKHNDLNAIGTDGYHHTFFEMLGNWSFGDYFKDKACKLAWDLLTKSYNIEPTRLYVTYFAGDSNLALKPDLECKEIWRSIGVPEDRIIPFGAADNFWEMGATGPCGPCTEIHIDHIPNSDAAQRARFVNANRPDLTELWNIVFIEFNRKNDGSLEPLRQKFIDTGMGFERLVAVMQGKSNNYDTDLFVPIFDAISKECGKKRYSGIYDTNDARYELDYAYRLVSDHVRMCSICIADGMYPQINHRLQKIMRKTFNVCEQTFQQKGLIQKAIVPQIVETLACAYPELGKNYKNICEIFDQEEELYEASKENNRKLFKTLKISPSSSIKEDDVIDFPGFANAFRKTQDHLKYDKTMKTLSTEYMFDELLIKHGLSDILIQKIATEMGLEVDMDEFSLFKKLKKIEAKSRHAVETNPLFEKLDSEVLPKTEYQCMYDYHFNAKTKQFIVEPLKAKIVFSEFHPDENKHYVILDRTNFYHTAGGQDSDQGQIISLDGKRIFVVENVEIHKGYTIHTGRFEKDTKPFETNDNVNLVVDATRRTHLTQHHTTMHLLQAVMKNVTNQIIFQRSSHVSSSTLKCELGTVGRRIHIEQLEIIENSMRDLIKAEIPIKIQHLDANQLYTIDNLTTVPGATYPESNIRLLTIKSKENDFESIEPCCGTHARNTRELEDFCFLSFKSNTNNRSYDISAVAGPLAQAVRCQGETIVQNFAAFKEKVNRGSNDIDFWESIEGDANRMKREIYEALIPHVTKVKISSEMENVIRHIRLTKRAQFRQSITSEMIDVISKRDQNNESFVVHVLNTKYPLDGGDFAEAEQMCQDLPVILLNVSDNKIVQGRASIPLKYTNEKTFNANHWIRDLVDSFKIKCSAAKSKLNLTQSKLKDIPNEAMDPIRLEKAIHKTKALAAKMFDQPVLADANNRQARANQLSLRLSGIREMIRKGNDLNDFRKINAETESIRDELKHNLYSYNVKSKCVDELVEMNGHLFEAQHQIEKQLFFPDLEQALTETTKKQLPYIFHVIHAEHPLHHRTIMRISDSCEHLAMILIIISKNDVIGRISIPMKLTGEHFPAKHFGDKFNEKFDGKCIHHGTRYDASVMDFELNKDRVNENGLKEVFDSVEALIEDVLKKQQ